MFILSQNKLCFTSFKFEIGMRYQTQTCVYIIDSILCMCVHILKVTLCLIICYNNIECIQFTLNYHYTHVCKFNMQDCCSKDGSSTNFYADDKLDEVDVKRIHNFGTLELARFVRVQISTDLRWFGHDEKCFRFEVLGCRDDTEADSNMYSIAEAPGYISIGWQPPTVAIPGDNQYSLNGHYYVLNISHDEGGSKSVEIHNTSDTSLMLPNPLWGSRYSVSLTCWHLSHPVNCGHTSLEARPELSASCRAHSSFCQEKEQIKFISPQHVTAKLLKNGTVQVKWRFSSRGWRAKRRLIRIETSDGVTIYERETSLDENEILIEQLERYRTYSIVFCPIGANLNSEIGSIRYGISILKIDLVGNYGAFVSDVGLETSVDWSGYIKVKWRPARVSGVVNDESTYSTADAYKLTLRIGKGTTFFYNKKC